MILGYFDNNATTRPHPEVVQAMMPHFTDLYLNASSAAGQRFGMDGIVSEAKRAVGALLGSVNLADEIVLTSGASEANSWAIKGLSLGAGDHVVSSAIEHPSVLAALSAIERQGVLVQLAPCMPDGVVDMEAFRSTMRPGTRLVSIMLANNETGVIQPVARLAGIAREIAPNCVIHCDLTQAVGRVHIDLSDELFEVDLASFSAHKFHGPKGVGGLFVRSGTQLDPLLEGEQEKGLRGGTINTPGAAGMAKAAQIALARLPEMERVSGLRDRLERSVVGAIPETKVNGESARRLPNTISLTLPSVDANEAVDELAGRGICIASGSACSSGSDAPSHVLTAMGVTYSDAFRTIRISLSNETTSGEIDLLVRELADVANA
ncbi:cysteine desulfurase [Rhizobium leguminosarum]|uniref:cysteine desulfurase family protein n=1 Tax=Rhizobium leguminosarum TaxID=384 RepID=UPI0010304288|nr:cysteine desulfurase family protein [Rhizobium leguminosarum]MBY5504096.1 cysteine desulfurase [Rhizobium leguminosarum]TBG85543.1 cysteine desulfurase [Rhizobium leguminosarum]